MSYENCPICGVMKHKLMQCQSPKCKAENYEKINLVIESIANRKASRNARLKVRKKEKIDVIIQIRQRLLSEYNSIRARRKLEIDEIITNEKASLNAGKIGKIDAKPLKNKIGHRREIDIISERILLMDNNKKSSEIGKCKFCGFPSIPGDDVCYSCK